MKTAAAVRKAINGENLQGAKKLPNFLQQEKYTINGTVCTPLTFVAKKEKSLVVLAPFSFVKKQ